MARSNGADCMRSKVVVFGAQARDDTYWVSLDTYLLSFDTGCIRAQGVVFCADGGVGAEHQLGGLLPRPRYPGSSSLSSLSSLSLSLSLSLTHTHTTHTHTHTFLYTPLLSLLSCFHTHTYNTHTHIPIYDTHSYI
jgi:hypothetical protein